MANSEDQMSALFEEGGIADEGMDTDPVSGNNIPPGSLPEEVRDDIPAMLSEGEYVVPADVLRFYGVKFFEDLRSEAKMGLAEMDSNGRIGGEPVGITQDDLPFSDEELAVMDMPEAEPVAAAKGGLMGFQNGGFNVPAYINKPDLSFLGVDASTASSGGLEYRMYTNAAGMSISIPFFDGAPMGLIPPGYFPEGEAPVQEEEPDTPSRSDDDDDGPAPDTTGTVRKTKTPEEMNNTDLRIQKAILTGAGTLFPLAKLVTTSQISKLNDEIDKRKSAGLYDKKYDDIFDSDELTGMFESDFSSPEKFKTALDYVAPEGMSWDSDKNTYKRDEDPFSGLEGTTRLDSDSGVNAFKITDSDAFVKSGGVRPSDIPNYRGSTGSGTQSGDSSSGDTKGFYESITGVKFKDTAFGKAIGLSDDDDDDVKD